MATMQSHSLLGQLRPRHDAGGPKEDLELNITTPQAPVQRARRGAFSPLEVWLCTGPITPARSMQ